MLDSIRWHLVHQRDFTLLALGVAGWMRYVGGVDDAGQAIEICDPLLPVIQQAVAASADGEARVKALLGIEAIFGVELPQELRFVTAVTRAYLAAAAGGCYRRRVGRRAIIFFRCRSRGRHRLFSYFYDTPLMSIFC